MKKNFLFGIFAAATMLLATSCQQDGITNLNYGDKATVSINLATPEVATRAYSDGTTATHLQYAVYNAAGDLLDELTVTNETINLKKNVSLKLTTGNTYTLVFWAAAPNAPYTVDFPNKTMSIDYSAAKTLANDEGRDAFLVDTTFTVTGNLDLDLFLRRPFAQLNIGTSDTEDTRKAGYDVVQTKVEVLAYRTLHLIDGTVGESYNVVYDWNAIPQGETFPVAGHDYMAMNYILVPADKEIIDVKFSYTDGTTEKNRTFGSVPVRRNYRTNLYGQLFTSDVTVDLEIMPVPVDSYTEIR